MPVAECNRSDPRSTGGARRGHTSIVRRAPCVSSSGCLIGTVPSSSCRPSSSERTHRTREDGMRHRRPLRAASFEHRRGARSPAPSDRPGPPSCATGVAPSSARPCRLGGGRHLRGALHRWPLRSHLLPSRRLDRLHHGLDDDRAVRIRESHCFTSIDPGSSTVPRPGGLGRLLRRHRAGSLSRS